MSKSLQDLSTEQILKVKQRKVYLMMELHCPGPGFYSKQHNCVIIIEK